MLMNTKIPAIVAALCIIGGTPVQAHDNQAQLDANKRVAQQYFSELIEKEDASYVDKLLAPEAKIQFGPSWKSAVTGNHQISGTADLKKHFSDIHSSKDISSETIDVVAEGDKVAIYRLTHEKYADGRKADVPWMSFFTIKNGKIVSVHHVHDSLSQLNQHAVNNKK